MKMDGGKFGGSYRRGQKPRIVSISEAAMPEAHPLHLEAETCRITVHPRGKPKWLIDTCCKYGGNADHDFDLFTIQPSRTPASFKAWTASAVHS